MFVFQLCVTYISKAMALVQIFSAVGPANGVRSGGNSVTVSGLVFGFTDLTGKLAPPLNAP